MSAIFDCLVIGKGLIGSAATRYLSQSGLKVAVIGPDEPKDLSTAQVFSSHYDEGRVQRLVGFDKAWTILDKQSTDQYPFLQQESGIEFHFPVGCLYVSTYKNDPYFKNHKKLSNEFDIDHKFFPDGEAVHNEYQDFVFPKDVQGIYEAAPSGHINPRLLIAAQLSLVKKNGGQIFENVVVKVSRENDHYLIYTADGQLFQSEKVVVTAGAFSNNFNLLPKKLALKLKGETIVLARVSKQDAERLSQLPSLLFEIETPELEGIYLIRPIQYPDGNYYLKIGCNLATDIFFNSLSEIQEWFRNGDSDSNKKVILKALHELLPNISFQDFITKRCIISRTSSRRPYVGNVDNKGLLVATGGNGYAAMCSDALGRVASHLAIWGAIPGEYPASAFKPVFVK